MVPLRVPVGTTALRAVELSGIQDVLPGEEVRTMPIGVFSILLDGRGNPAPSDYRVEEGDRVELYRSLLVDPKQARLNRAAKPRERASRLREKKTP